MIKMCCFVIFTDINFVNNYSNVFKNIVFHWSTLSLITTINQEIFRTYNIFIIENNLQKIGQSFFHLSRRTTMQHAHRFFHLGVHVPFYLHFWGCNVPSNSSFLLHYILIYLYYIEIWIQERAWEMLGHHLVSVVCYT
jgi:hypothetical protein